MQLELALPLLLLLAIVAGLVGALTGLGGGVVVIPALVLLFGVPVPEAIGAGAVTILASSSAAGAAYVREHLSDLRIGMFLEVATVPGALLGASATVLLTHAALEDVLLVSLGVVLLLVVPGTLARRRVEVPEGVVPDARSRRLGLRGGYHDQALDRDVTYQAESTRPALGVMFGAGVISGMFGIGAGVFKVLALERYLRLPMKVATATSNFMIGVTAAAGAGILFAAGFIDPLIAAPVAVGTSIGAFGGSRILPHLRNQTVRYVLVPFIILLAVESILRGFGIG